LEVNAIRVSRVKKKVFSSAKKRQSRRWQVETREALFESIPGRVHRVRNRKLN